MHLRCMLLILLICAFSGCGDPPLQPVTGKVTLGGKSYERLIVYFRPLEGKVNEFNMGVGETDPDGNLSLRSTAGDGLQRGTYRVSFSCVAVVGKKAVLGASSEKMDDDRRLKTKELVPEPYSSDEESPVEFEITTGENRFEYDIPAK